MIAVSVTIELMHTKHIFAAKICPRAAFEDLAARAAPEASTTKSHMSEEKTADVPVKDSTVVVEEWRRVVVIDAVNHGNIDEFKKALDGYPDHNYAMREAARVGFVEGMREARSRGATIFDDVLAFSSREYFPDIIPPMSKKTSETKAVADQQSVLLFASPPGGVLDPKGALAPSVPITPGTAGQVLTSDGTSAAWQPSGGTPAGVNSVSAYWGDSAATLALPSSSSTALPIDTITQNPSGAWSISGTQLQYSGPIGVFLVTVSINAQNTGLGTGFGVLIVSRGATVIAQMPFQYGTTTIGTVTASAVTTISGGGNINCAVSTGADNYQIIGNALGGAVPHTSIQYNIVRVL